MDKVKINCKTAVYGEKKAEVLFTDESFSFWGGVDTDTGEVADKFHETYGKTMKDKVFVFPFTKGSSGAGLVLLEMIRTGVAPAAIINLRSDPVIITGPLIGKHFYDIEIPLVNVSQEDYDKLKDAKEIEFIRDEDYINVYY